jgi:hypothetical protein
VRNPDRVPGHPRLQDADGLKAALQEDEGFHIAQKNSGRLCIHVGR